LSTVRRRGVALSNRSLHISNSGPTGVRIISGVFMSVFPQLKIATRLPFAVIGSALLVSAGVGVASYLIGSATVDQMTRRQIETVALERAQQFTTYLDGLKSDLINSAAAESVQTTLRDFSIGWGQFAAKKPPLDVVAELRAAYIENNPNPAGQRQMLDVNPASARSNYDFLHSKVHPNFRKQLEMRGYYDLFLFDKDGNLVYSVMKNDDFASNFAEGGGFGESDLGQVYREAMGFTEPGQVAFADLGPYVAAGGQPASFMATTVFDPRGKIIGVMAVQMPVAGINQMMQNKNNLGDTGESFFVGADHLLRSDSSFTPDDDTLTTSYENSVVDVALAGGTAYGLTSNYRGQPMLATAVPVNFSGANWALVTTIAQDEAFAPIDAMRDAMLVVALGLLALVTVLGLLFSRTITVPISRLTGTMAALAEGRLETEVKGTEPRRRAGRRWRAPSKCSSTMASGSTR